jgi:hypothetical protein
VLRKLHDLRKRKDGAAAIEFALVFPLLLLLFYAEVEFCNYLMVVRRAAQAANFAGEFLSRDNDDVLDSSEQDAAGDIWMVVNSTISSTPSGRHWATGFNRSFASISFDKVTGCSTADCEFTPRAVWTSLEKDGAARPFTMTCKVNVVENSASRGESSIPRAVTGRGPIVVVDFTYRYLPLISGLLLQAVDLHESAIRKTRSGAPLNHTSDERVTRCS